jgi:DNA-binding PadR family transcriptional regulator
MAEDALTELELLVMLSVLHCSDEAYGVPILEELRRRSGRKVLRPTVYEVLRRLERRELLVAEKGEPLPERGGRARKYYALTARGREAVATARHSWEQMWQGIEMPADGA